MSDLVGEEIIEELLARTNIAEVIGDYVQLAGTGDTSIGLCPFIKEDTPSFYVDAAKGYFYCGSHHESGNVFRFVMQYKNLSFFEACRFLATRVGMRLAETTCNGQGMLHLAK